MIMIGVTVSHFFSYPVIRRVEMKLWAIVNESGSTPPAFHPSAKLNKNI